MSYISNTLGQYAYRFDFTNCQISDIYAAIESTFSTSGWEVYDSSAGTNTDGIINTCVSGTMTINSSKVYRSLCKDNISYKYVRFSIATSLSMGSVGNRTYYTLFLTPMESWDSTTKIATNPATAILQTSMSVPYSTTYGYDSSINIQQLRNNYQCQLFLFISPRWLATCTKDLETNQFNDFQVGVYSKGNYGIHGCFEVNNPISVAGFPNFIYVNTAYMQNSWCRYNLQAYAGNSCSLGKSPRMLVDGGGTNGTVFYSTLLGSSFVPLGNSISGVNSNIRLSSFMPITPNPYTSEDWALAINAYESNNQKIAPLGEVYGLKVFTNRSAFGTIAQVKCNSDFQYVSNGTNLNHFVIVQFENYQFSSRTCIPIG